MTQLTSPRAHTGSRLTRWIVAISTASVMLVGLSGGAAASTAPTTGAMFGAHVERSSGLSLVDSVGAFEHRLGRSLAVVNKFHDWSMTSVSDEKALTSSGHLVMVSWHPTDGAGDPNRASKVANGTYDSLIRTMATNLRGIGAPVLLRWDFEMTQSPGQKEYVGTPSQFIAAWQHIHNIFVQLGATNVEWVWAPQSAGFANGTAPKFWPGSSYVDWIEASDVLGGHSWPTFAKAFTPFYTWSAAQGKPLMAWVGLPENPSDPSWKANWLQGMRSTIKSSMPKIKAVVYFHAVTSAGNFRADTSSTSWSAYSDFSHDAYFDRLP